MEGTARVFAGEYCSSTLSVQDDDPGNPAWVVTIGGAWCRFMFLSGALTEVTECGDMVYTRIADPTGVFDLVIGGRNTALAETFCKLPVPSFVTVTGRAQMYLKKGVVVLSVRPDNVVVVKRRVRDQWVLATAKSTLERLQRMNIALQGTCADERILAAVRHYSITNASLRELALMVEGAVQTVRPPGPDAPAQPDIRTLVMELITAESGLQGIAVEEIINLAAMHGVMQETVLAAIESLILDDECYQPRKGFVRPL
jgi:RPA family protein